MTSDTTSGTGLDLEPRSSSQPTADEGPDIGWLRAALSALGVLVIGAVAAVGGANAIMTRLTSVGRGGRQWLATVLFFAVIIVMAWVLRRLQARKLI